MEELEAGNCRTALSRRQTDVRVAAIHAEPLWLYAETTKQLSALVSGNTDAPSMHDFIHVTTANYPWKRD